MIINLLLKTVVIIKHLEHFLSGFPGESVVKNLPAKAGDAGSIPGSGRSAGEGNGNPLQYSCLGNLMDRGAWWATVRGHKESDTTEQLKNNTSCHVGNAQHTAVHSRGCVSLGNTIHLNSFFMLPLCVAPYLLLRHFPQLLALCTCILAPFPASRFLFAESPFQNQGISN